MLKMIKTVNFMLYSDTSFNKTIEGGNWKEKHHEQWKFIGKRDLSYLGKESNFQGKKNISSNSSGKIRNVPEKAGKFL